MDSVTASANSRNLPLPLTPLIGREHEVAVLSDLLHRDAVRLLTLTGPGGVGKTRLALQVATDAADAFPDGVVFVNLAPITDPGLVAPAIAQAVGVRETSNESVAERLVTFLRDKQILLVLDNFEQVVEAAPIVANLLQSCLNLKILVTSRVRLRLSGEREHGVPSLVLPAEADNITGEAAQQSEAVRLFVTRAQAVQDTFALTDQNASEVTAICRRLDGLPLAIELAAARIKVLPTSALLTRLDRRLPLLTGGGRDLPARQQTMRDTIAWSYDLLTGEEQALFRRLAVFAGGCTLSDAEGIATAAGAVAVDTLSGVISLVENSLLRQEDGLDGEPRFGMLETIREFGLGELTRGGEAEVTQTSHAAWCLALAESAETAMDRAEQGAWLLRLDFEHDNLRAALNWLRDQGNTQDGLRLAAALSSFWLRRGYLIEGRAHLQALLELSGTAGPTVARASALSSVARLALAQSDYPAVQAAAEEALALWRRLRERRAAAQTLLQLAWVSPSVERETALAAESLALYRDTGDQRDLAVVLAEVAGLTRDRGDLKKARALLEESLTLYRALGDRVAIAWPLAGLGLITWYEGDDEHARALYEESRVLFEAAGDQRGLTWAIHSLGLVAWTQGQLAQATTYLEHALTRAKDTDDHGEIALVLACLGYVSEQEGNVAQAREQFAAALRLYRELEMYWGVPLSLEGLAGVFIGSADAWSAARILGAAAALRELRHFPLPPVYRARFDGLRSAARAKLGSAGFARAWAEGQEMSLDKIVAEALAEPVQAQSDDQSRKPLDAAAKAGLTPRERDVLHLLVEGRTDKEIADTLFIGPRTVQTHVANLFVKLGVNARAEAAAVAVRRGLV
jgi:predicted ATPase/DNA-binding CsgD family transcriptional regulator